MRTVIVTGGSSGIGLAVARHFASGGDRVVATGRRQQALDDAASSVGAKAVAFDASDPVAVNAALDQMPTRVDVLVNNAGGNTDFEAAEPEPGDLVGLAAQWRANLQANLLSAVLVTAALRPRLGPTARVVSIGSIAAHFGAGSYGAAKAALHTWNLSLATELGTGGTANVVSPGLTVGTEYFRGGLDDARRDRLVAATSTGRAGTVDDVTAAVAFLASLAAGHITGQVLHVNGGAWSST